MAKTKKTTPTSAAPLASQHSDLAQGAMQHLRRLNFLLLKETKELREKIMQLRSELDDAESDSCSTAEACAAEKEASAEKTAALLKKANAYAADVCLAKKMLLAAFRDKKAMEMDLERAMEERDSCQAELDQERMRLRHFKQVSAQNFSSLIVVGTEYCRRLEEGVKSRERALHYAAQEMNLVMKFLKEKLELIVELERENERVREEGKMREGQLLQSARHEKNLLEEQLTIEFRMLYVEMKNRKQEEIHTLTAEIESKALKIQFLEEECCRLNKSKNQLTHEVTDLQSSLDELEKKSKWRWLYPAAATVFALAASFAFAARARPH